MAVEVVQEKYAAIRDGLNELYLRLSNTYQHKMADVGLGRPGERVGVTG